MGVRIGPIGVAAVMVLAAGAIWAVRSLADDPRGAVHWEYDRTTRDLISVGNLVCGTSGDSVFCLSPASGRVHFVDQIDRAVSDLTVSGDTLLALVEGANGIPGQLRAYAVDGERLWIRDAGVSSAIALGEGDPAAAGDVVAAVDGQVGLVGFDRTTGENRWVATMATGIVGTRVLPFVYADQERFYVIQDVEGGPFIVAVAASSGHELWRWPITGITPSALGTHIPAAVSFDDGAGMAFLITEESQARVVGLATETGAPRWEVPIMALTQEPFTFDLGGELVEADGVLVARTPITRDISRFVAVESDGTVLWPLDSSDVDLEGQLSVDDDVLVAAGPPVVEADPQTSELTRTLLEDVVGPQHIRDVEIAGDWLVVAGEDHVHGLRIGSSRSLDMDDDSEEEEDASSGRHLDRGRW